MATPRELVECAAKTLGISENSVVQHDRNLAAAGLRSIGGRGRAAAKVTHQDAANLIIAVAASRNVKDSAATVKLYAPLVSINPLSFGDIKFERFGEALAALLEAVPSDRDAYAGSDGNTVDIMLYGPQPRAVMEIHKQGEKHPIIIEYEKPRAQNESRERFADLQFISRFTQVTLGYVGELVRGDD